MKTHNGAEKKYIVQFMGMRSEKFGGLERFMISLSKSLKAYNIYLILIYQDLPLSKEFLKQIHDNTIELIICNPRSPSDVFRTLRKVNRKYKPPLIHCHFQPVLPCLFARILGIKYRWVSLRTMIHDTSNIEITKSSMIPLKTKLIRKIINLSATRLLTVSDAVKEQYKNLFPGISSKIETFYMGSDQNTFSKTEIKSRLNFSPDIIHICTVAFASPMKGFDQLFEAAKILKTKYKIENVKFCLIGLDENIQFTKDLILRSKELGIEHYLNFMGISDNVPQLLKAMDIYVQPSITEAISMTLMEAAMAKLPLIGTKVGGIPEIVIDHKTGYLFELGDADQLAANLNRLIIDPELRENLGKNALDHALLFFNREKQISRMTELYLSLSK